METEQIISWLRDHAKEADPSWRRVMVAAADKLEALSRWRRVSDPPEAWEGVEVWDGYTVGFATYDPVQKMFMQPGDEGYMEGNPYVTHWRPVADPPGEVTDHA